MPPSSEHPRQWFEFWQLEYNRPKSMFMRLPLSEAWPREMGVNGMVRLHPLVRIKLRFASSSRLVATCHLAAI